MEPKPIILWNCTHFRHPTDEQLQHRCIFLATTIICSLSTLNLYNFYRGNGKLAVEIVCLRVFWADNNWNTYLYRRTTFDVLPWNCLGFVDMELTQQDGWKTQDGTMMKKCRIRLRMHSLALHFFIILPSWVFQRSCCISSQCKLKTAMEDIEGSFVA